MQIHGDAKSLKEQGDSLFSKKRPYDSRNQDIADNFFVERADFTVSRGLGDDYAAHLATGYPAMVRRDLGNSLGSMLRPKELQWFHTGVEQEDTIDHDGIEWLEWSTGLQRKAMYDRKSMFTRATKEGDQDYSAFGGNAISCELNRRDQSLIYRCWHLRDVSWTEDSYGQHNATHRNWKPTATELCAFFGDKVHSEVAKLKSEGKGSTPILVRHAVIRSDEYTGGAKFKRYPWVSVYIDVTNGHIMQEVGSWTKIYNIARWATVSGSPYPYSPASVIALPDARLLQAMTFTLLDAGEMAVKPPTIGVAEAIRGDLNLFAGGFTAVDAEYDERLGEVLRPLTQDKSGLGYGMEMSDRTAALIREAFYLNTLSMPPAGGPDMTAYEVGQRVQEYIRQALPLFEPIEDDYNAGLCDLTFETLMAAGAFGPPDTIPESIRGRDVSFKFESPLSTMIERQKGQKLMESQALIALAVEADPTAGKVLNFKEALRDSLHGIGTPASWMNSKSEVAAEEEAEKEMQNSAAMLDTMQKGADVASTLSQVSGEFDG